MIIKVMVWTATRDRICVREHVGGQPILGRKGFKEVLQSALPTAASGAHAMSFDRQSDSESTLKSGNSSPLVLDRLLKLNCTDQDWVDLTRELLD